MLKQFREFAVRGNVVDLAIGVIIGAAFGNIVSSLVAVIFMPLIGAVIRRAGFLQPFHPLSSAVTADNLEDAKKQGAVIAYGHFLTLGINFLIVAWICFSSCGPSIRSRCRTPRSPRRRRPAPSPAGGNSATSRRPRGGAVRSAAHARSAL